MRLNDREKATVLAALRNWQLSLGNSADIAADYPEFWDIATNLGTLEALNADEVDNLCERVNLDGEPRERGH